MSKQNILGIDVSRDELVIFDNNTENTIKVVNSKEGLSEALKQHSWDSTYEIGLESTGDFSLLPMKFFIEKGFVVKMINPILTKKFINTTIRKKKTDKSDAQVIVKIIEQDEGQVVNKEDLNITKKTLLRLERKLTSIKSDLKRMSLSLDRKSSNGINLDQAKQEIEELITSVEEKADNLFKLAQVEPINNQEKIINSHIGCGEKLSAIISTEAGDITRFPSAKQLKAYAGIDPRVIQSGQLDKRGRMTKRGNPVLRQALYLAAFVASNHDPELKEYYQKKRNEGKSHTHAVCTVARKMCERIYATVTQNRMYQPVKTSNLIVN